MAMTLDAYLSENGIMRRLSPSLSAIAINIHRMRKQGQTPNRALMAFDYPKPTGGKVQPAKRFLWIDAA